MSDLVAEVSSPLGLFLSNSDVPIQGPDAVVNKALMHPCIFSKHDAFIDASPIKIGIVFSGGPAPGGHDVVCGVFNHLRPQDELIGFCNGFGGLLKGQYKSIRSEDIQVIKGTGGFDFLGTDRTKIKEKHHFDVIHQLVDDIQLNALIVVGGDDSNTNALFLANELLGKCCVIGVPKTIDGDVSLFPYLWVTFGFHSACQHYSRLVHQLKIDSVATQKYWHVVKLMGRSASHVALEVAHQTQPHACLLSEEIFEKNWGLLDVIKYFCSVIAERARMGHSYGVIVFPEGIIEVIPEFRAFLNGDLGPINSVLDSFGAPMISAETIRVDDHGNPNVSMVPSETIIQQAMYWYLRRNSTVNVSLLTHFFGYTGRSESPTVFDIHYSQLLGKTAYELVLSKLTGVIAGCDFSDDKITPLGIPLHGMLHFDSKRSQYVIQKTMVSTAQPLYQLYLQSKLKWVAEESEFPRQEFLDCPRALRMRRHKH
jgi:pyrophosphate--fructose-6-phosphate 1-phosphotransferase